MPAREDQEKRALRILEAAGELVLRWGYDKTTVDDIARAAGVAKGTIYLHWKTRENLFTALLRHERVSMAEEIRRGVEDDPNGVTLAGVVRQLGLSLEQRPIVRAFMLRDSAVIGKLLRQAGDTGAKVMSRAALLDYLTVLREHGIIRTDVSAAAQANLVIAVLTGFLVAEPMLGDDAFAADDERPADLMADAVRSTLDRGRKLTVAERRTCEQATRDYLDRVVELSDSRYYDSVDGGAPTNTAARSASMCGRG